MNKQILPYNEHHKNIQGTLAQPGLTYCIILFYKFFQLARRPSSNLQGKQRQGASGLTTIDASPPLEPTWILKQKNGNTPDFTVRNNLKKKQDLTIDRIKNHPPQPMLWGTLSQTHVRAQAHTPEYTHAHFRIQALKAENTSPHEPMSVHFLAHS